MSMRDICPNCTETMVMNRKDKWECHSCGWVQGIGNRPFQMKKRLKLIKEEGQ